MLDSATQLMSGSDAEVRDTLMENVRGIAEELEAEGAASDADRKLTDKAAGLLASAEVFGMRLPRELGGLDIPVVHQMEVIEAIAEIDASAAWCVMLTNNALGKIAEFFPDDAVACVFDGSRLPFASTIIAPKGKAVEVEDGYRVSGRWRFASGISRADWVACRSFVDGDPSRVVNLVVRASDVQILDNWDVVGLRATSSCDFIIEDAFVPASMTFLGDRSQQLRGEHMYVHERLRVSAYEHLAIATGVGRRALRELEGSLVKKSALPAAAAHREVVQTELSKLTIMLEALRTESHKYFDHIDVLRGEVPPELSSADREKARALTVYATDIATECVRVAFDRIGAEALSLPNPLERMLRDITTARAHVIVRDSAYPVHGAAILEDHGAQLGTPQESASLFFD